jgi:hypothetical protein
MVNITPENTSAAYTAPDIEFMLSILGIGCKLKYES